MLGKQWLKRYASVDMRGSAIERSQNRQRKLNGIVTWYFDHVMELLPLMLQFALLLLGGALSRYLWGIDKTVGSAVLTVISLGAGFYAFIIVAGTASKSCPYQTPGAQIIRYLWRKVLSRSTLIALINESTFTSRVYTWFFSLATKGSPERHPGSRSGPEEALDRKVTALDFGCASWILQTSLDQGINGLTLKFILSIIALPGFTTTIVADCFNIFIGCVSVIDKEWVVVLRGSEQIAETAATCLFNAISHSLIVDPKSNVLKDVQQRYNRIFPPTVNLQTLPFRHTISGVRNSLNRCGHPRGLGWKGVDPSTPENLSLAHNLVKVAWSCCKGSALGDRKKVPRWVLRFSLHSLLWDPERPASAVADCLMIIAIDLGCDVSERDIRNLDKRYVYPISCIAQCPDCPSATALGTSQK